MIDLSPPAALLLQVSGVLYGLLLAYYAFALDRVTRSIRENSNRLKGWQRRSFARESTDPRPSRTEWEAFVKGERREHTRRILLALSVFGSSVLFLVLVSIAGLTMIELVPKVEGEWIVSVISFLFLIGVPGAFIISTALEFLYSIGQRVERATVISEVASFLSLPFEEGPMSALLARYSRRSLLSRVARFTVIVLLVFAFGALLVYWILRSIIVPAP